MNAAVFGYTHLFGIVRPAGRNLIKIISIAALEHIIETTTSLRN